jgi:hypothetical protein
MVRSRASIVALASALTLLAVAVGAGGCGGGSRSEPTNAQSTHAVLASYLHQVEPIRLAVNRLLDKADPILAANHRGRISALQASRRMEALERRFAAYTVDIAAIEPGNPQLRALHAIYAHTYVLEDSYLSALVSGLAERDLGELPDTQSEQRAAIIQWRTGLTVLARRAGYSLPRDLQAAGRGEIAPSPDGG